MKPGGEKIDALFSSMDTRIRYYVCNRVQLNSVYLCPSLIGGLEMANRIPSLWRLSSSNKSSSPLPYSLFPWYCVLDSFEIKSKNSSDFQKLEEIIFLVRCLNASSTHYFCIEINLQDMHSLNTED
jgi:hypothetical protein